MLSSPQNPPEGLLKQSAGYFLDFGLMLRSGVGLKELELGTTD